MRSFRATPFADHRKSTPLPTLPRAIIVADRHYCVNLKSRDRRPPRPGGFSGCCSIIQRWQMLATGVWFESRIQVDVTSHETLTSQALSFAVSESSNQAVFFCCGNRRKALQDCLSSYRRRSSAVICRFYS